MDREMIESMLDDIHSLNHSKCASTEKNIADRLQQSLTRYEEEINQTAHFEQKRIKKRGKHYGSF